MIYSNVLELIGNTPLVRLHTLNKKGQAEIVVKLENLNPAYSVKDRVGLGLIQDAEQKGKLAPGATIIEPTSGNTGIGLALACSIKGYQLILVMPENMSKERQTLLKGFGAKIVLTPAGKGMGGAVEKAKELHADTPGSFFPDQFSNPANPAIHALSTAQEIWQQTAGKIDMFVAGVGSGGTLTGTATGLKEHNPDMRVVAVEPAGSAVLSGDKPGAHQLQGIGAGFIPEILNLDLIDEVFPVGDRDAIQTAKNLLQREGILCGISSGANVWAALQLAAREENKGKRIVTIICDTGERYLSTALFQNPKDV